MERIYRRGKICKDPTEARLKVSFFKPIWAGYNVIDIDEDYQYALVAGSSLNIYGSSHAPPAFPKASASVSWKKQEKLAMIREN
jgi:apolipoprotein D and lipocalin family protein